MTVFVDDARLRFGRMVMCHMWAGRVDERGQYGLALDELLAMADRIDVQRKWIQGHPTLSLGKSRRASWVHFDIALCKKRAALAAGAVLTDRYGPLEHAIRLGRPSPLTLDQIAALRERRNTQTETAA